MRDELLMRRVYQADAYVRPDILDLAIESQENLPNEQSDTANYHVWE